MTSSVYGTPPGSFRQLVPRKQKLYAKKIFKTILEGNVLSTACWANDVDPDEFDAAMAEQPSLWKATQRHLALAEVELVRRIREGGPGMSPAKAALASLTLTRKAWMPKTQIDFTRQFEDALGELKTQLPEEHYATVIKTLARFS